MIQLCQNIRLRSFRQSIQFDGLDFVIKEDIARGHKLALHDVSVGAKVHKYGFPIGVAKEPIKAGDWVHTHNVQTGLDGTLEYDYQPDQAAAALGLDGLYMGGPFALQYGQMFNEPELTDLFIRQEALTRKFTKDESTGLYKHAWDASKQVAVCDKETGQTTEVWGRALGWYVMTLADVIE